MVKRVAVILSGCGHLDGSEIRESVLSLLTLSQEGAEVSFFALNKNQHHTINHLLGEEVGFGRDILEESARIARGKIDVLDKIILDKFDALLLPGGYGAAKNLSTFAFEGSTGKVDPELARIISEFHRQGKPIGAICIAPVILALVLGNKGLTLTIGNDIETAKEIEKTGAVHKDCKVTEVCIDEKNRVVTTPAYMFGEAHLHEIFQGISECIKQVLNLVQ